MEEDVSKETVVLIVDDELELERHLKRKAEKFKEKKLRFVFVDSGIEAVEYLSVNKPDIIFLDILQSSDLVLILFLSLMNQK